MIRFFKHRAAYWGKLSHAALLGLLERPVKGRANTARAVGAVIDRRLCRLLKRAPRAPSYVRPNLRHIQYKMVHYRLQFAAS